MFGFGHSESIQALSVQSGLAFLAYFFLPFQVLTSIAQLKLFLALNASNVPGPQMNLLLSDFAIQGIRHANTPTGTVSLF